ncbi:uncharacterized protein LOC133196386 isoform X2 [Saccostrea echinata]|uniref:uncharacterized protein LOC133196386 isoform X2 n=1 Tax=Saccostrea echinata TaxID=191078 RepID=UPI002A826B02|nr:uncharacterized protein LOC133196386 isoform X2 [Saccostrea echinata]
MSSDSRSNSEDDKSAIHIIEDDTNNTASSTEASNSISTPPLVLPGPGYPWDNKWTHAATKTLLELYVKNEEKFKDPHTKKKQIWGEISEILRSKGFTFDAEKCERKFLNLKTVYRNNVQHNCMTGNFDRKCSFFDELDSIFHLSTKLKSNKKPTPKLPDVVEPKRIPLRNPANETTPPPKVVPVPVLLIPNGGKVQTEPEKSPSLSTPTQTLAPQHTRININASVTQSNSQPNQSYTNIVHRYRQPSPLQRFPKASNNLIERNFLLGNVDRSQTLHTNPPAGTAVIDLCQETSDNLKRGSSEVEARTEPVKKRRASDLQSLLESFENYRREQREREEQRMRQMKEMHEDEMKVTNRFLDIIHQYVQNGNN